jgi:hypothetical protein
MAGLIREGVRVQKAFMAAVPKKPRYKKRVNNRFEIPQNMEDYDNRDNNINVK